MLLARLSEKQEFQRHISRAQHTQGLFKETRDPKKLSQVNFIWLSMHATAHKTAATSLKMYNAILLHLPDNLRLNIFSL